jgi:hypothetical protein
MGSNIDNRSGVPCSAPYLCNVESLQNDPSRFHDQGRARSAIIEVLSRRSRDRRLLAMDRVNTLSA